MDLLKALDTNCHMLSRKVCSRWAYLNGQCYHHTPSVKDPFPHQGQPTEPEHLCRLVRVSSLLDNVRDIKQKCFCQISIWREWKERGSPRRWHAPLIQPAFGSLPYNTAPLRPGGRKATGWGTFVFPVTLWSHLPARTSRALPGSQIVAQECPATS